MDRSRFDKKYRERLERLSTTNISDALDKVGAWGAVIGIRPLFGLPRLGQVGDVLHGEPARGHDAHP